MSKLHLPSQLQSLTTRYRLWQITSQGLILVGTTLILLGGGQLYGYYYDLSHPPAPIINSVTAFATPPTKTPTYIPSTVTPTLTPTHKPAKPLSSATPRPTPTPTVMATATAISNTMTKIDFSPPQEQISTSPEITATPVTPAPITRIVAKSIDLDAPVIQVGWVTWTTPNGVQHVWQVANFAAGWHKNSALPGEGGNIVLSAHHNMKGEVFRYTVKLSVGDVVTLYEGDKRFDYQVTEKFIVKDLDEPVEVQRANARWIGSFDEERLTLVTCWPYIGNTHRVIVIAKPLP